MNEQDIVALGHYCEALMRDDTFNSLCGIYKHQSFLAMMSSQPHEVKNREGIYAQVQGLQNFLGMLASFVQQKDAILAAAEEEQTDADIDREFE